MNDMFSNGSVPVAVAARVYGKDATWVRAGIISGWLPIGKATRKGQLITNIDDMNSNMVELIFIFLQSYYLKKPDMYGEEKEHEYQD